MDQLAGLWSSFAAAHPFYAGVGAMVLGFALRSLLFTKENARAAVKWYFDRQRKALLAKFSPEA